MPLVVTSTAASPVTVSSVLARALRLAGVLASGETPDATMQADALEALNSMLDAWRTESLLVHALRTESLTITGAASYTVGDGGDLDTVRPVKIEAAFWRSGETDYPLAIANAVTWSQVGNKSLQADVPEWLYYEPAYPLGVVYLSSIPSSGTLHLVVWTPISEVGAFDEFSFPPGYRDAITYQLAMRLCQEYGRAVTRELAGLGKAAKDDIKRVNFRAPIMQTGLGSGRPYDIRSGR